MSRVVNWTHRDWMGAASVKVGVSYDADPEQVIAILKKCAEEHPLVLRNPPAGVALESFGPSAMQFNLGFSLSNIDKAYAVQSDLRIAILRDLRAAGIEVPFNHLDVTLRDGEALGRRQHNGASVGGRGETAGGGQVAGMAEGAAKGKEG